MANIKLVITIPEEIRLALINNIQLSIDQQSICDSYIKQAIINGTPLIKYKTQENLCDGKPEYVYKNKETEDKQLKKPGCHFCDHLKDEEYCEELDINPCYPEKGCDFFEPRMNNIQEICDKVKELSERVGNLENQIIEEKEKKIKAERRKDFDLWWECERCGKPISYMANFFRECEDKILGNNNPRRD